MFVTENPRSLGNSFCSCWLIMMIRPSHLPTDGLLKFGGREQKTLLKFAFLRKVSVSCSRKSAYYYNFFVFLQLDWSNYIQNIRENKEALCSSDIWKRRKFSNCILRWHSGSHAKRGLLLLHLYARFPTTSKLDVALWFTLFCRV